MTKIKLIADQEKVEKITEGKDAVTILLTEETTNRIHVATLVDAAQKIGRDVSIGSQGNQIKLVIKTKQLSDETLLAYIIELLEALIRADKSKKAMSAS